MIEKENIHKYFENTVDKFIVGSYIDTDELRQVIMYCEDLYSKGALSPLTDTEYDKIYQIYLDLTEEVIRGDTDKQKVKHDYPLLKGTLKKVHYVTQEEKDNDPTSIDAHKVLYKWYEDTYKKLDPNKEHKLGFWFKFDGCSVILSLSKDETQFGREITKAITRGEEEIGIDKSSLFQSIMLKDIVPSKYDGKPVGVKTEIIMPLSYFDEYNKKFADPVKPFATARNAMTSLLNSNTFTSLHRKYIGIRPLMMCIDGKLKSFDENDKENGPLAYFKYDSHKMISKKEMSETIAKMRDMIDKCPYDCDGIVVRWYDDDAMETLGRDEANYVNNFEIAYKFPRERKYSRIIDIRQDIGMKGKLSLTAIFEPVVFNNRTVTHASLGSYERAKRLKLAKGDMIGIQYEIVPYLYLDTYALDHRNTNEKPIELRTTCPYCGSELQEDPEMSCTNLDCPSRIQGKLLNFCERAEIVGIGESLIEILFQKQLVNKIEDFFDLKNHMEEFCAIDGMGLKTWKKICNQFDSLELTQAQILSSVNIKSLGPKNSKKISNIYYIQELLAMPSQKQAIENMVAKGISPILATNVAEGVMLNKSTLKFLLEHINVIEDDKKSSNDIDGCIVFTGFRNTKFKKYLEELNYEVSDNVTKRTTLIIADNPDGVSGKLTKGRKLGIRIISVPEAYALFKF